MSIRKYHSIQRKIDSTGDEFRVNGHVIKLPFSAATQTDKNIIPGSYHVAGMVLQSFAVQRFRVSACLVEEIVNAAQNYVRDYLNNPSAAKHSQGWIRG